MTKQEFYNQIQLQEFNECPGAAKLAEELEHRIGQYIGDRDLYTFEIADLSGDEYWANDSSTLVLRICNRGTQLGLEIGKLALDMRADEFDWVTRREGNKYLIYLRLWWD
jgi:hypothetical protein